MLWWFAQTTLIAACPGGPGDPGGALETARAGGPSCALALGPDQAGDPPAGRLALGRCPMPGRSRPRALPGAVPSPHRGDVARSPDPPARDRGGTGPGRDPRGPAPIRRPSSTVGRAPAESSREPAVLPSEPAGADPGSRIHPTPGQIAPWAWSSPALEVWSIRPPDALAGGLDRGGGPPDVEDAPIPPGPWRTPGPRPVGWSRKPGRSAIGRGPAASGPGDLLGSRPPCSGAWAGLG